MNRKKEYKKILGYFLKKKSYLVVYIITALITVVANTITPLLSAKTIEAITAVNVQRMIYLAILLFVISIIEEIIRSINMHSGSRIQALVALDIKKDITNEIFKLETKNFDKEGTGFFSSRINSEPYTISSIISSFRYNVLNFFSSVGIMIYIFIISYQIALLLIGLSLIIFIFSFKRMKIWEKLRKEINSLNEKYTSNFSEIIRGIRDIKVLNMKKILINKTVKEQLEITEIENNLTKKEKVFDTVYWVVRSFANLAVVLLGAYLIYKGKLSGANLLIVYMYRSDIFYFFQNISSFYEDIKRFNLSFERLYELIDDSKYRMEKYGDISKNKIEGNIEFKNVSFAYDKDKVLKNMNFKIKPNETIGFVGKSGQGKTTVFNLISKLYSTNEGKILIDGIDINDLNEESIRKNISVITQNPYVFNLSIKENLKLANPDISDEEMKEKSKLCALHDFVETLPDKYDTKIGEGGVTLSGGQRQRLAIARALIKNSEIILFDEATSSLDNETQDYIQESIKKIGKDYTILIIAHRLSTVKNCDKIIVIDEGRVEAAGTHTELIKKSKIYKGLYKKELS